MFNLYSDAGFLGNDEGLAFWKVRGSRQARLAAGGRWVVPAVVATADGGAVRASALVEQTEHLLCADERKANEGALQRVEDDEDVPEHGHVGERRDEAEHPSQTHDRRQLHVEHELTSLVAAGAFRVSWDQAQVLDDDAEQDGVDGEKESERQRERDE